MEIRYLKIGRLMIYPVDGGDFEVRKMNMDGGYSVLSSHRSFYRACGALGQALYDMGAGGDPYFVNEGHTARLADVAKISKRKVG